MKREAQVNHILDEQVNTKKKAKNSGKRLKGWLKTSDETGAIDIASLLIALLALTIISGLIATTVYVIIPWSRDNLAKWQLSEVANAEAAYAGLTISNGGSTSGSIFNVFSATPTMTGAPTNAYGSLRQLIQAGVFPSSYLGDGSEDYLSNNNALCVVPMSSGSGFQAAILSDSGKIYAIDQNILKPQEVPNGSAVCNGTVLGPVQQDPNATATASPTPTPTATSTATASPTAAPSATPTPTPTATTTTPSPSPTATATASPTPSATTTPTASPTPTATPTPTPSASSSLAATPAATPSPTATATPPYDPNATPLTPLPNQDPNAKTRKFMYCHNGHMISTSYQGMLNGHTGMNVDIIPPVPDYGYPGWNWTADTAKIYYNNCKPLS